MHAPGSWRTFILKRFFQKWHSRLASRRKPWRTAFFGSHFLPVAVAGVLMISGPLASAEEGESRTSGFVPKGYTLIWNDEFSGTSMDPQKWRVRYPGVRGAGWISGEASTLDGVGHLLLTTREQEGRLLNGHVGTAQTFKHTFGYWEARVKFEKGAGQHGCFWLQSDSPRLAGNPRASGVEVDVAEFFGPGRRDGGLGQNVYWQNGENKLKREGGMVDRGKVFGLMEPGRKIPEWNEDFHVYGLLWTAEEYVFLVDGRETFRTREGVSHQPAYAVLSLFTAEWEVGRLDRAALPDSMIVDYVRVYDDPAASPP